MQKKWYCALINIVTLSLFGGSVLASTSAKPYIATGYYTTEDYKVTPLMAVSQGDGNTWSYPSLSDPQQYLKDVNCNQRFCVLDGWLDHGRELPSVLSVSIDQGKSWLQIKPLMQSHNGGSENISCNDQACFIVGYQDLQDKNIPVVAMSKTGTTWEYKKLNVPNVPKDYFVELHSISCTNQSCVAVGGYRKNEGSYEENVPFIATSQDQGITWVFSISKDSSKPYSNYSSVHCDGDLCLASEINQDGLRHMLVSHDAGVSWHKATVSLPSEILQKTSKMRIKDIHCSASWCVASGILYNKTDHYISPYPALIMSQDKGETWSYPTALLSLLPQNVKESFFYHTSCYENVCMAAGGFIPSGACVTTPSVILSIDRGETWTYQSIPSPLHSITQKPKKCDDNGFINISCDENRCIAAGSDQNTPILAVTQDKGKTWFYPFDKNILPKNFSHGGFEKGTR